MAQGSRKLGSVIWELEMATRLVDDTVKIKGKNKVSAKCLCRMDMDDPTITCNKVMCLTDGSTTTLRHHIKDKHPAEYARILQRERERIAEKSEAAQELDKFIADVEGDPDEPEEDLSAAATPGRKRFATGEAELFETPQSKRKRPDIACKLAGRNVFHRFVFQLLIFIF
jgi:hypothetical protein